MRWDLRVKAIQFGLALLFCSCRFNPSQPQPVNQLPVANAGLDTSYNYGDTIWLDASASIDSEKTALTFIWTPPPEAGLPAMIIDSNPLLAIPPLPKGTYVFHLRVHDGHQESRPAKVTITIRGPDRFVSRDLRFEGRRGVYPTISEAVIAARLGDTIWVDSGSYWEDFSLTKDRLTVLGRPGTRPVLDGKGVGSAPLVRIERASDILLEGFEIRGAPEGFEAAAVHIAGSRGVTLRDCFIRENLSVAIRIVKSIGILIDTSLIEGNIGGSVASVSSDLRLLRSRFRENRPLPFSQNRYAVIEVTSSGSLYARGNRFLADPHTQILAAGPVTIELDSNIFDGVGNGLLALDSGSLLKLRKNAFRNMSGHCIHCEAESWAVLESIEDTLLGSVTPIWCKNARKVTIVRDSISNLDTSKPKLDYVKGIDLGGCESGILDGNVVKGFHIAVILNSSPVLVERNRFQDNDIGICNQQGISVPEDKISTNHFLGSGMPISTDCVK